MTSDSKDTLTPVTEDEEEIEVSDKETKKNKKQGEKKKVQSSKRAKSSGKTQMKKKSEKEDSTKTDKLGQENKISSLATINMISSDLDNLSKHLSRTFQSYGVSEHYIQPGENNYDIERQQRQREQIPHYFMGEVRKPQYHYNRELNNFYNSEWRRGYESYNNFHRSMQNHPSPSYDKDYRKSYPSNPSHSKMQSTSNFFSNSIEPNPKMSQSQGSYPEEANYHSDQNYELNENDRQFLPNESAYNYQGYNLESTLESNYPEYDNPQYSWMQPKKDIREIYKNKPKYMFIESELSSLSGSKTSSFIRPPQKSQNYYAQSGVLKSPSAINVRKGI